MIGRKQDAKHSLMESVVLIQVANASHCNSIESFMLGISSEKATAANLQKYQGLKSYWGSLKEKSPGSLLPCLSELFLSRKVGPEYTLLLLVKVFYHKLPDRTISLCPPH